MRGFLSKTFCVRYLITGGQLYRFREEVSPVCDVFLSLAERFQPQLIRQDNYRRIGMELEEDLDRLAPLQEHLHWIRDVLQTFLDDEMADFVWLGM